MLAKGWCGRRQVGRGSWRGRIGDFERCSLVAGVEGRIGPCGAVKSCDAGLLREKLWGHE